jgi:glycosyltransferase involved in cell wall biosynthesis
VKIALVGPVYPYRGGIAHYTAQLYAALAAARHDLWLTTFRRQYPQWLFPGKSDRDPSDRGFQVAAAHTSLDSLNPLTWLWTLRELRAFGPDVLILQWWTTFWSPIWLVLAWGVRWRRATRLVFLCHNVVPHDAKRWERWLSRLVLAQGDGWVVHTEEERARLTALLPHARPEVAAHPVYDIFDTAASDPAASDPAAARARLGLSPEGVWLLFFGMVRPYKGLDDLLAALPQVIAAQPEVRLLVAGDFWGLYAATVARVAALGLSESVILRDGYIANEDVPFYFAAADALVAPYRRATGSGVVQTARGLGLPVIGTDAALPAQARVAGDQVAATGNPDELAAAILAFVRGERPSRVPSGPSATETWQALIAALLRAGKGSRA